MSARKCTLCKHGTTATTDGDGRRRAANGGRRRTTTDDGGQRQTRRCLTTPSSHRPSMAMRMAECRQRRTKDRLQDGRWLQAFLCPKQGTLTHPSMFGAKDRGCKQWATPWKDGGRRRRQTNDGRRRTTTDGGTRRTADDDARPPAMELQAFDKRLQELAALMQDASAKGKPL
jgi:hypothetical protein